MKRSRPTLVFRLRLSLNRLRLAPDVSPMRVPLNMLRSLRDFVRNALPCALHYVWFPVRHSSLLVKGTVLSILIPTCIGNVVVWERRTAETDVWCPDGYAILTADAPGWYLRCEDFEAFQEAEGIDYSLLFKPSGPAKRELAVQAESAKRVPALSAKEGKSDAKR